MQRMYRSRGAGNSSGEDDVEMELNYNRGQDDAHGGSRKLLALPSILRRAVPRPSLEAPRVALFIRPQSARREFCLTRNSHSERIAEDSRCETASDALEKVPCRTHALLTQGFHLHFD